ncbi:diversity-generating retroelement protein Avd [Photobacterium damselae]|uniref:diversity-generating retroelement protein Avd n=1 Tax=Photobacterium damselae TaxID=38293 RepID=UPI000D6605E1|nr:diversity-generating retroelement protein Avd [Photobacterium damselae]AWK84462.1 four helix bundle protein [Photobacterium damselae]
MSRLVLEEKCNEMIMYGYVAIRQFPKHEKHVLGAEIRISMLTIQRLIITALKRFHKKTTLTDLDIEIAVLLRRVRLAKDLRYIDNKKYQLWAEHIVEMGKMTGGWIRSLNQSNSKAVAL